MFLRRDSLFFIILLGLVVVFMIVFFTMYNNRIQTKNPNQVYASLAECEKETRQTCQYFSCDYVPPGKTAEQVCGERVEKGFYPQQ